MWDIMGKLKIYPLHQDHILYLQRKGIYVETDTSWYKRKETNPRQVRREKLLTLPSPVQDANCNDSQAEDRHLRSPEPAGDSPFQGFSESAWGPAEDTRSWPSRQKTQATQELTEYSRVAQQGVLE
ncbi:hypothetical protein PR048_027697 [Dryococelus australis]|uniref:Uncharacterized protein n=1 Tax=Dryococelus australis TaxID=614101 RepID=A0ABQ9GH72_9NEOP|nr:hypothetical protein PR048_027697 [Dryococelus australis]